MKSSRHGGFISVFVEVPVHMSDTWHQIKLVESVLKGWSNWREPGGAVEIIRDDQMKHSHGNPAMWVFELVWYNQDRANATLFKLTYGGRNPLVD